MPRRLRPVDEVVDELIVVAGRHGNDLVRRNELEERALQLLDPGARRGGDAEHAHDPLVLDLERRRLRAQVDLVQHDHLRPRVETGAVRSELRVDRAPAVLRVGLGRVDHVQQQPRALEMREELMAEPDALARALDQPGHVGDDELPAVGRLDGAEHGRERRERILRDLRLRVREARDERRLARVRQADERGVGEQLQAQLDRTLLPEPADLCEPRRLPCRPREALVAATAAPALRDDDTRAGMREVGDQPFFLVEHLGADRNVQDCVLAVGTVREPSAAGSAFPGAQPLIRADAREVATRSVGHEHDVAALAAVTAVRAALRDELLAPEMDRAVAAATRDDRQLGAIVKHDARVSGTPGA